MIASRIRCARPALVILTIMQLGACGDASESPPARVQVELERELLLASQELEIATKLTQFSQITSNENTDPSGRLRPRL